MNLNSKRKYSVELNEANLICVADELLGAHKDDMTVNEYQWYLTGFFKCAEHMKPSLMHLFVEDIGQSDFNH